MLKDGFIIKNGEKMPTLKLLFIEEEEEICDGCFKSKKCATMQTITEDVFMICKDCLQEILNELKK